MKKIKWIIGIVIIILIVACIIYSKMQGIPVLAAKVEKGKVCEYVEERAVTSLPKTFKITMPLSGRIMPIELKPGTLVKKGQLIAKMDDTELKSKIEEITARIDAIKGQITINEYNAIEDTALQESTKWIKTMGNLVKVSEKKVEASESVYKYAVDYEEAIVGSGQAVSRIKDSKAKTDAAVAKVNAESARIMYNAVAIIDSIFKLAPVYINEYINIKKLNRHILESQLAEAQATLKEVQYNLDLSEIKSPIDGIVLNKYVSNYRFLPAGTLLIELGNLNNLEVTSNILSEEAINISSGDNVEIFGAAIGDLPIIGKVQRVDPKGFTKLSSLGVEQQRVHVKILFDKKSLETLKKSNKKLGDGFRLQVKVYTAEKNNVIKVPRTALFKSNDGKWKVYVIKDNKAYEKVLEIGLINDNSVEVVKGLNTGDEVILAPSNTIVNGTRVSYKG